MLILTPAEFGNPAERARKLKLLEEEKNAVQIDNPNLFSEEF